VVKVSGMGEPGIAWIGERNRAVVRFIIDTIGAEQTMFGSDFPMHSLCVRFAEIIDGMRHIVAPYSRHTRAAFFGETARQVYLPRRRI
jgi:predicted TIM-barrel fold metal-dependent hydrolase